jgi:glutamate dehydrogenase (NAD(P)+)
MDDIFSFADDFGPLKVIHVTVPEAGVRGVLVVDNIAAGPSIGGLRMAPDVSVGECFRLARAMTMKNAAAGLPHGGGKSVLVGDPRLPKADKARLVRGFASALRSETGYIFGPDMGTDEECMAWVRDEIGRSVGLPRELGGIPLDELGATGYGLAQAAEIAIERCDFELRGARLAVQGFGSVGIHAARFLREKGVVLVGAADSGGTIHDPKGLDIDALVELKQAGKSVTALAGTTLGGDAIVGLDCDIWIPAARPDIVDETNVDALKARMILQGANIPITPGAERILHERGVVNLPDFIANAGGVICAAMEYAGATETAAFQAIAEKIRANTRAVLDRAQVEKTTLREAAVALAGERVRNAMATRRWSVF